MKISILCVGKIKEDFYKKAVLEYMKRLSRYCKPEIIEVPDEKTPERASETLMEQIKEKEGRTEDLRNEVLMLWAGKTNNIMAGAE